MAKRRDFPGALHRARDAIALLAAAICTNFCHREARSWLTGWLAACVHVVLCDLMRLGRDGRQGFCRHRASQRFERGQIGDSF